MAAEAGKAGVLRVVGIYNADGGLSGELRYAVDKLLGRNDCGLCDLTHGWNAFGKRAWRQACRASTVPIELIHRDQATPTQLAVAGSLPVVLVGEEGAWRRAADAETIRSMRKDPAKFLDHLEEMMAADGW